MSREDRKSGATMYTGWPSAFVFHTNAKYLRPCRQCREGQGNPRTASISKNLGRRCTGVKVKAVSGVRCNICQVNSEIGGFIG